MPKFAVLRDLPLTLTRSELDGMAIEGIVAMDIYPYCRREDGDPGIEWIRTYWQPGSSWGLCLYEAPSTEELWRFQTSCGLEALEIREVTELVSATASDGTDETAASLAPAALAAVEAPLSAVDVDERGLPSATALPGGEWIRTYWDEDRQTAIGLYAAGGGSPDSADGSALHWPVVEIAAAAYRD